MDVDLTNVSRSSESSSSPPPAEEPTQMSSPASASERLQNLTALDHRIAEILKAGSQLTDAIAEGKMPPNTEQSQKRENFKNALNQYNSLVEEVNHKLRKEVQLLHEASRTQLHPLNVPIQASGFGKRKERQIFESIWEQQDKME